jgi:hypothetical protein
MEKTSEGDENSINVNSQALPTHSPQSLEVGSRSCICRYLTFRTRGHSIFLSERFRNEGRFRKIQTLRKERTESD